MPSFLESTADKFTFRVATDRLYSPEGLWVLPEAAGRVRVGLADFTQQRSGDLALLSVKPPGTKVEAGEEFAEMETVKVTQTLPCPVTGTILEANGALELTPEVVNQDPYGAGWLALVEAARWDLDRSKLLDASAYFAVMRSQIDQESKR